MKTLNFLFTIWALAFLLFSCGGDEDRFSGEWTIPTGEVFDGGVGIDGIPSVENPDFSDIDDINFLNESSLVVGVVTDTEVKAYPHPILDWHEIVNDEIGNLSLAITYCPLTGTAIGWDRNVNGTNTTFGVSGKLYNSNLIPFDRNTDSYWSQMGLESVNGDLIRTDIVTSPVIETSWETWKALYPDSKIMNTNTGFDRNYFQYPYGDYRTNNANIIFPVTPMDNRRQAKERALAVLTDGGNKAYSIREFESDTLIVDAIGGTEIIVAGSLEKNFMVAFEKGDSNESFEINLDNLPVIAESSSGMQLTIAGELIENGIVIDKLNPTNSYIGYWFALGAFYPDIEIYEK